MAITKIHPIKSTLNFHEKLTVYQAQVKLSKTPILEECINIDKKKKCIIPYPFLSGLRLIHKIVYRPGSPYLIW